jgi:hypothetical protein
MERNIYKIGKELFITSEKEIKEGDWVLNTNTNSIAKYTGHGSMDWWVKIILTTDVDLIKDGVQAIDDEFLEWFVKNPSCEWVELDVDLSKHNGQFQTKYGWKIIIPQEEPKQIKCYCGHTTYCDCSPLEESKQETLEDVNDTIVPIKKVTIDELLKEYGKNLTESEFKILNNKINIKQETLEEAAERILANNIDGLRDALQDDDLFFFYKDVIQCYGEAIVKWQAQRMYSEEDMFTAMGFASAIDNNMDSENKLNLCIDFIKNFKNK